MNILAKIASLVTPKSQSVWYSSDLSKHKVANYALAIEMGEYNVTACIINPSQNTVMGVKSLVCTTINELENFLEKEEFFNWRGYKKVILQATSPKFLIVPEDFYREKANTQHFELHFKVAPNTKLHTDKMRLSQSQNIFSVNNEVVTLLQKNFGKIEIQHHLSSLIEQLAFTYQTDKTKQCYINVRQNWVDILVLEGSKLHYANQFEAHTPEDVLYYVLQVAQVLELNQELTPISFLGAITQTDALCGLLLNYFKKVGFVNRNNILNYTKELSAVEKHEFYTLFAALCV